VSDSDETPPRPERTPAPRAARPRGGRDDDLVGPRRGAAAAPPDEELVGRRRRKPAADAGTRTRGTAPSAARAGRPRPSAEAEGDERPRRSRGVAGPAKRRRRPADEGELGEVLQGLVRDIPAFIKLLVRLARDRRVSRLDKAIVLAALAYMVTPEDLIPDSVAPYVGQVEDVFFLGLALSRLLNNAGIEVLLEHWEGDERTLEAALALLDRAGALLPQPVRSLLGGHA